MMIQPTKKRNNIRLTCFVAAHIKFIQKDSDNNFLAVEDVTVPALLKYLDNLLAKSTLLCSIQEYWQMASDGKTVDIDEQLKDLQKRQQQLLLQQLEHEELEMQLQMKQSQQEQLQEKQHELEKQLLEKHQLQEQHLQEKRRQQVQQQPPQPIYNIDHLKEIARELDWTAVPRMSRDGTKQIELHKRKTPCEALRLNLLYFVEKVIYYSNLEGAAARKEVLDLCAKLLFYDFGYKEVKGISNMYKTWDKRIQKSHQCGNDCHPTRSRVHGYTAYTDKLEEEYPGYIRELFRYAQKAIGFQASFMDIAKTMNEKSKTYTDKPDTTFNKMNIFRWFVQEGGNLKSPVEKPYLTDDQKANRKEWCEAEKARMREWGTNFHCCFLDEKWFYVTSRRRKLKVLPASVAEDADEVAPHIPKAISRRHPNKVSDLSFVAEYNDV